MEYFNLAKQLTNNTVTAIEVRVNNVVQGYYTRDAFQEYLATTDESVLLKMTSKPVEMADYSMVITMDDMIGDF